MSVLLEKNSELAFLSHPFVEGGLGVTYAIYL